MSAERTLSELEKMDTEMRMETLRGTAAKLSWDELGGALRRNLMVSLERIPEISL